MLSRLAAPLKSGIFFRFPHRIPQVMFKAVASTEIAKPNVTSVATNSEQRDLVNFPHPIMNEHGGLVRLKFIPDEFFQFFYRKTGVTGPYLFGFGLLTFLVSKELWVLEHELKAGVWIGVILTVALKKFGPQVTAYLDEEIDKDMENLYKEKNDSIKVLTDGIKFEEIEQERSIDNPKDLFEARRENVMFQLEAEYRKRMMNIYQETKKRLDYQVQVINITRQVQHKHMVNWIIENVIGSITPQQEEAALKKCIADLNTLSAAQ